MKRFLPLVLLIGTLACDRTGFECGRALPIDPTVVRRCDRAGEVCVCATNSCARPARTPAERELVRSSTACSNFVYAEQPFAHPDLAGECVLASDVADEEAIIEQDELGFLCPGEPPLADVGVATTATTGDGGVLVDTSTGADAGVIVTSTVGPDALTVDAGDSSTIAPDAGDLLDAGSEDAQ